MKLPISFGGKSERVVARGRQGSPVEEPEVASRSAYGLATAVAYSREWSLRNPLIEI